MNSRNIFENITPGLSVEVINTLLDTGQMRIERIVSHGQASPKDFWYDQDEAEWVILLEGSAVLEFEDQKKVEMKPGDYINIRAHCRHRVDETSPDGKTVWLIIFYQED